MSNTQPPTNARREAVRLAQTLRPRAITAAELKDVSAQDPCGFGVSRGACHVGCGRRCRNPAR